jgi:DAK2 domain fusion protein YloV
MISCQSDILERHPLDQPLESLDGAACRLLFCAAYDWLAHHHEEVNRLNVFPVPDGDTGTNMLLTLKAAWAAIEERGNQHPDDHTRGGETAGSVFMAAAEGAHHGSRGNSGVILSQMLRGMASVLTDHEVLDSPNLALALAQGSVAAYTGVPSPVEGTILTVTKDVSAAAEAVAAQADLRRFFDAIVRSAAESVERTPDLLPLLKDAGVVDSGGRGLYYVLDGMARALKGELTIEKGDSHLAEVVETVVDHALHKGRRDLPDVKWGFDVQFLVEQPNKFINEVLADISAMGDCPLVEGDGDLLKVHVHVFDPGAALSYGVSLGFVTDVVVENMDDMAAMAQLGAEGERAAAEPLTDALSFAERMIDPAGIGVVAVSPGPGFTEIFHDLGVHVVVRGGQTMNPSTAQIVEAVEAMPCRSAVILPNNGNIVLAAQQAASLLAEDGEGRTVDVVPSTTAPQGIAAMLAYDPAVKDLGKLAGEMRACSHDVRTGEVTQAVRSGDFDGVSVEIGDTIALVDGRLVLRSDTAEDAVLSLLALMVNDDSEIVSLYHGDMIQAQVAEKLTEQARNRYPELDVESASGGQPHYAYIVSVE